MGKKRKKILWNWWAGGGSPVPGDGLIKELYQQSGNSGDDIRISIRPIAPSQGAWSPNVAYSAREIRTYPTGSELFWISNQSTNMGESPYTNPEKWDLAMGLDFIQNIGGGKWSRVSLQRNVDEWVRENNFSIGTYAPAFWVDSNKNYDANVTISQTSDSTVSVPTTHPSSRAFTIATGLATIPDSTTLGTCSDTFSVPTARSQFLSINLPAGLSLDSGDYVTLYGNANNFFVCGIVTYDNVTGATYGWCINFVGTGSFSSWTVKSELLLYAFQTGAETSRNFQFLVQTYVSGTGVVTGNSITHVGSGSTSTWTITRNKVNNGIPSTQGASFIRTGAPLEAIGASFKGGFTGSGLRLNTQKNTTGTGWMIFYVGGPDIANPPSPVTIDTYAAVLDANFDHIIWNNLTEVHRESVNQHRFVAVSITSPSVSSTNTRPFINASTTTTNLLGIKQVVDYEKFTDDFSLGYAGSQSLGETVFIFAPTSGDPVVTWPYHGDLTDNNTLKKFFVDNVEVLPSSDASVNSYLRRYLPFTTAYVEQEGTIFHPAFLGMGDFASYESIHRFDKYGFFLEKLRIELLQSMFVGQWYPNLLAMADDYIYPGRVIAQDGEIMEWPNSGVVNMSSTFKGQNNYLFISDTHPDYAAVMYWPDVSNWRIGQAGRGADHIENLVGSSSKFRPYAVFEYNGLPVGYVMDIQARIYLGNKGAL